VACSPDGLEWLTLALDPFHDYQRPVAGYPDTDNSHTIVSCQQSTVEISHPPFAVGNWDCHVYTQPFTQTLRYMVAGHVQNGDQDVYAWTAGTQIPPGIVGILSEDAGNSVFPNSTDVYAPIHGDSHNIISPEFNTPNARVIGWGVEVTNTTAELNKQGTVTVYRMPQNVSKGLACIATQANLNGVTEIAKMKFLPSNASAALKLGGAQQWAAKDGVYMVVTQSSVDNPLVSPTGINPVYCDNNTNGSTVYYTEPITVSPGGVPVAQPALNFNSSVVGKVLPYNSSGAIFSGLSNSSTLRIRTKVYIERAPTIAEQSLSVLASPSAPYDSVALRAYSDALSMLPPGVPVGFNAAGDWWKMVLKALAVTARPLGSMLGPFGSMAGNFVADAAVNKFRNTNNSNARRTTQVDTIDSNCKVPVINGQAKKKKKKRTKA